MVQGYLQSYYFYHRRRTIYDNVIVVFFFFFCLIEPRGIHENYPDIDYIYNGLKYVAYFGALPLIFLMGRPSKMFCLNVLYITTMIVSSIINGNLDRGFFFMLISIFFLCVITEYYMKNGQERIFLKGISFFLFTLFFINLMTIILFPEGMYTDIEKGWSENYFLGFKNDHINILLPCAIVFTLVRYMAIKKVDIICFILYLMILISCLLCRSTTSLLSFGLFSIVIFIFKNRRIPRWISPNFIFFTGAILSALMIFSSLSGALENYTEAASEMADKETDTMAVRGLIWVEALICIFKHPIIGSGYEVFEIGTLITFGQAHNQYLDIFVVGGLFLFLVFLAQSNSLTKVIRRYADVLLGNIIIVSMMAYSIEFLAEGKRTNFLWYVIILIAYHLPRIMSAKENRSINK